MIFNGSQFTPDFAQGPFPAAPQMPMPAPAQPIDPLRAMGGGMHVSIRPLRPHDDMQDYRSISPRGMGATRMEGGNAGDFMTPGAAFRQGRHGQTFDPVQNAMAKMMQQQIQRQFFYHQLAGY